MEIKRKWFFIISAIFIFAFESGIKSQSTQESMLQKVKESSSNVKLFLCGDVMTGRGVDQALPHSVDPVLYESYVKDAGIYLQLAEQASDKINVPVSYKYIWGDALQV